MSTQLPAGGSSHVYGGSIYCPRRGSQVYGDSTPPPAAPVNTSLPVIDNTSPRVGDVLTVTDGIWSNSPASFSYQWVQQNIPVPGATNDTYSVTTSDVGLFFTCVVTATNAAGSTPAESSQTNSVPPYNSISPSLSDDGGGGGNVGSPIVGDTLTVSDGSWFGGGSPTYQWYFDGVTPIPGATTNTRLLSNDDLGHTLSCIVTQSNAGGSTDATSNTSGTVT